MICARRGRGFNLVHSQRTELLLSLLESVWKVVDIKPKVRWSEKGFLAVGPWYAVWAAVACMCLRVAYVSAALDLSKKFASWQNQQVLFHEEPTSYVNRDDGRLGSGHPGLQGAVTVFDSERWVMKGGLLRIKGWIEMIWAPCFRRGQQICGDQLHCNERQRHNDQRDGKELERKQEEYVND